MFCARPESKLGNASVCSCRAFQRFLAASLRWCLLDDLLRTAKCCGTSTTGGAGAKSGKLALRAGGKLGAGGLTGAGAGWGVGGASASRARFGRGLGPAAGSRTA